uniref:Uncharacterized protein n=1 Tax=Arundo donax TaxID=35708 RepID=A0A0A9F3N8_ARUDO
MCVSIYIYIYIYNQRLSRVCKVVIWYVAVSDANNRRVPINDF